MMNSTDDLVILDPERLNSVIKADDYLIFSFVLCICKCVLSFPIITGNGLILTIISHHTKKSPSHVSVSFLACADLSAGLAPWFFSGTLLEE